jgi:hypothetical protein
MPFTQIIEAGVIMTGLFEKPGKKPAMLVWIPDKARRSPSGSLYRKIHQVEYALAYVFAD